MIKDQRSETCRIISFICNKAKPCDQDAGWRVGDALKMKCTLEKETLDNIYADIYNIYLLKIKQ